MCGLFPSLFNYCWNTLTVEGDSPVDFGVVWSYHFFLSSVHWKLGVNLFWEASTSNSKYFSRPIVYLVPRGNAEKDPFVRG